MSRPRKKISTQILIRKPILIGWEDSTGECYVTVMNPVAFKNRLEMLEIYHRRLYMKSDDMVLRNSSPEYMLSTEIEQRIRADKYFQDLSAVIKSPATLNDWRVQQTVARLVGADSFLFCTRQNGWEMIYEPPTLTEPVKRKLWLQCTGSGMSTRKLLGVPYQDEDRIKNSYSNLISALKDTIDQLAPQ